jgi:hypothetical protein
VDDAEPQAVHERDIGPASFRALSTPNAEVGEDAFGVRQLARALEALEAREWLSC